MVTITYPMPIATPTDITIRIITEYNGQITLPHNLSITLDKYLTGTRRYAIILKEGSFSKEGN
tara:strand:+ start:134 stop:322 length:189 start_codon:yes stop_codon:yes gene_type:complete